MTGLKDYKVSTQLILKYLFPFSYLFPILSIAIDSFTWLTWVISSMWSTSFCFSTSGGWTELEDPKNNMTDSTSSNPLRSLPIRDYFWTLASFVAIWHLQKDVCTLHRFLFMFHGPPSFPSRCYCYWENHPLGSSMTEHKWRKWQDIETPPVRASRARFSQ